ncbi:hypothetical protein ABR737_41150 [Streptomyces sp. Edi2]|uniref:hypothetical protein n=1 Tax=Streptomyces sp. Edi2 TaxID=3162528 RepID=UPI0033062B81
MTTNAEPRLIPHPDRLERLRGELSGATGLHDAGRNVSTLATREKRLLLNPAANLLYGVMLRAAARYEQNEELTDLEERLLGVLRLSDPADEEIKAIGLVFREQADAPGTRAVLPQELTSRPLSQGYAITDLVEAMPRLSSEIAMMPNYRLVRVDEIDSDGLLDTEDAAAARAEYGGGAIICLTAEDLGPFAAKAPAVPVRVEYNKFHAVRAGEGAVGRVEAVGPQRASIPRLAAPPEPPPARRCGGWVEIRPAPGASWRTTGCRTDGQAPARTELRAGPVERGVPSHRRPTGFRVIRKL